MAVPKIINDISLHLMDKNVILSKQFQDGRVNASINEAEIIKAIQQKFTIEVPRSRAWFDFAVEKNSQFYPVNIKVTDTTHADNLNCKLGIYYALSN